MMIKQIEGSFELYFRDLSWEEQDRVLKRLNKVAWADFQKEVLAK